MKVREISVALSFLASQQQTNGSFLSVASNQAKTISHTLETTFATSLILNCLYPLRHYPLAQTIITQGLDFLLNEKNTNWSWNYWQRESTAYTQQPYPADWDDTACALITLSLYKPEIITPKALAYLTKLLLLTEDKPGGPYYTWLLPKQTVISKDLDLVVNANIAYFLTLQGIELMPLKNYLANRINSNSLTSLYYHTPEAIIYFLSRVTTGVSLKHLSTILLQLQQPNGLWTNDLLTALAVSSLLRAHAHPSQLTQALYHLQTLTTTNTWQFAPLYIERSANITLYAGTPALTTAFTLEALALYDLSITRSKRNQSTPTQKEEETKKLSQTILNHVHKRLVSFPIAQKSQTHQLLEKIIAYDKQQQITLLPYMCAQTFNLKTQPTKHLLIQLGQANVYGWLAYTIYDNLMDKDTGPDLLPVANTCLRELIIIYKELLDTKTFLIFQDLMDKMEQANAWEYTYCRFTNSIICKEQLNPYPTHLLSDKSLPHALGPLTLLFTTYPLASPAIISLQAFFTYYLQARQSNDDAHDWQSDLAKGFLNSVSFSLLQAYFKDNPKLSNLNLKTDISKLQTFFWQSHLIDITQEINIYLFKAQAELEKLKDLKVINDLTYFKSLLAPLEKATQSVHQETDNIKNFYSAFMA